MEEKIVYVANDGTQFKSAQDCQYYEQIYARIREISDARNPVSMEISPHRTHINRFLSLLETYIKNEQDLEDESMCRENPLELAHAVKALIYLADYLRKVET